jgi:hypothetical protein
MAEYECRKILRNLALLVNYFASYTVCWEMPSRIQKLVVIVVVQSRGFYIFQ